MSQVSEAADALAAECHSLELPDVFETCFCVILTPTSTLVLL